MPERLATVGIFDSGGRAHVLAEAYAKSPHVGRIIVGPGNDLIPTTIEKPVTLAKEVDLKNAQSMVRAVKDYGIDIADVSQDNAVAAGAVDEIFEQTDAYAVGPTRAAGKLEWSKAFARAQAKKADIPQPDFHVFRTQEDGIDYINKSEERKLFIKASGLAGGKGAIPAYNRAEAIRAIKRMSEFADGAGDIYLVEEWILGDGGKPGREFSAFAMSVGDEDEIRYIGSAQDYKRVNDGDEGDNTGGMGAVSPAEVVTPKLLKKISSEIFKKIIGRMEMLHTPYNSVLFVGGMAVSENGIIVPKLVEFNARWGDPEAQVIVPGILNDFFGLSMAVAKEVDLDGVQIQNDRLVRVAVAGVSRGYPGDYSDVKGKRIYGLDEIKRLDSVRLYGAGIEIANGNHFANGGRLFYVVGEGKTVSEAADRAYDGISRARIEGDPRRLHFRTDIGADYGKK